MHPFNDDNLKRLKEKCNQFSTATSFYISDVKALVNRLEAAERFIDGSLGGGSIKYIDGLLKAWRKAAGK